MRLWSLHPSYLDAKGLVALWREGLLARKVLAGGTKGYTNHPQLDRFKAARDPLASIDVYLEAVVAEADARGYAFDRTKLALGQEVPSIPVTDGQLAHERIHLKGKLEARDPARVSLLAGMGAIRSHPLFRVVSGGIEPWERV